MTSLGKVSEPEGENFTFIDTVSPILIHISYCEKNTTINFFLNILYCVYSNTTTGGQTPGRDIERGGRDGFV